MSLAHSSLATTRVSVTWLASCTAIRLARAASAFWRASSAWAWAKKSRCSRCTVSKNTSSMRCNTSSAPATAAKATSVLSMK